MEVQEEEVVEVVRPIMSTQRSGEVNRGQTEVQHQSKADIQRRAAGLMSFQISLV